MTKIVSFLHNDSKLLAANSYLLYDEDNNAVVIDPSLEDKEIINYAKHNKLKIKAILLTHGHYDHIRGVDYLVKHTKAPLYISTYEVPLLTKPEFNGIEEEKVIVKTKAIEIDDNDIINVLNEPIKVIATPYHTEGGVCYYLEDSKILISGDSLFKLWLGRTDLITSCPEKREESLKKLMKLPDDVIVYPGHGYDTTIGNERKRIIF